MKTESSVQARPRRSFLNVLLGSSFTAVVGSVLYPILEFLMPPRVSEPPQLSTVAGTVSELPVNTAKVFPLGNKPAIVIHSAQGTWLAFTAVCTHLDCTVQYRADLQHLWCACHNGHYDLTGKNIAGPPPRPLTSLKVNLQGDKIVVSRETA